MGGKPHAGVPVPCRRAAAVTIPTPEPRLTRDHLEQLFTKMAARRVVVVGDAMLDIYLAGDAERISPEAPVPVVTRSEEHTSELQSLAYLVCRLLLEKKKKKKMKRDRKTKPIEHSHTH